MFCPYCRRSLTNDSVVCHFCGYQIRTAPFAEENPAKADNEELVCPKCGSSNPGMAKFCFCCGQSLSDAASISFEANHDANTHNNAASSGEAIDNSASDVSPSAEANTLTCPQCGSTRCTPIVETTTRGRDFSASQGCCGLVLLGPIGILCGACGQGKQVSSTTYWMCSNCGNKFKK